MLPQTISETLKLHCSCISKCIIENTNFDTKKYTCEIKSNLNCDSM